MVYHTRSHFGDKHGYVTFCKSSHLKNNPPSYYSTSQSQPSSIQIPRKNFYFPNHPYPPQHHRYAPKPQHLTLHPYHSTMQAPQYETPLHQVTWHHAPLMPFPIPLYQMSLYQRHLLPYRQHILATMPKSLDRISAKISSRFRSDLTKLILLWLSL